MLRRGCRDRAQLVFLASCVRRYFESVPAVAIFGTCCSSELEASLAELFGFRFFFLLLVFALEARERFTISESQRALFPCTFSRNKVSWAQ